jgi:hypothetical protein
MALTLEEAADAFGTLCAGRPEALIALLDPKATWTEYRGARRSSMLGGADELAGLLRRCVGEGRSFALTGIAKGNGELEIGYSEPWWLERRGIGAQLAYHLLGDARQTVSVGDRIDAIISRTTYFAPRSFEVVRAASAR